MSFISCVWLNRILHTAVAFISSFLRLYSFKRLGKRGGGGVAVGDRGGGGGEALYLNFVAVIRVFHHSCVCAVS